ncbi:MAG: hypothetical protein RBS39_05850 [Phycisphaerales bacterium]|jgi:hypothetical protein|nr:hypothetical protein [Phycisphaerales bacterium]
MKAIAALAASALFAVAANAQTMNFSWQVSDTGNGDGVIEPGENARLSLWASWNSADMFAASLFNVTNVANFDTGSIVQAARPAGLASASPLNGTVMPGNSIMSIDAFQFPVFINPFADASNPIKIYEIEWQPADYSDRIVQIASQHTTAAVYNMFGSSTAMVAAPQGGSFHVVPAPGSVALLAASGLCTLPRRRKA